MAKNGINPALAARLRQRSTLPAPGLLTEQLRRGDRTALSRAITLVESQKADHQTLAREVVGACLPHSGVSLRVGITGSPGVGKSTFIEALGGYLIDENKHRVAVLAVDPSSPVTRGSILGDKTRMNELSHRTEAFVRPSAAGHELGGVARATRETIVLVEAAGYDVVLVETVGVGQSETTVRSLVDCFLLLLLPNAGDELQGIKRGVVEMADLVAVNKADGDQLPAARAARRAYRDSLHLFPARSGGWSPTVHLMSARERTGVADLWTKGVLRYLDHTRANGYFAEQRRVQSAAWFERALDARLRRLFVEQPGMAHALTQHRTEVLAGTRSPFAAAETLVQQFLAALRR